MSITPSDTPNPHTPASGTPEPGEPTESGGPRRNGPSRNRIVVWIIGGGIGLYLVVTGLYGILVK
ncbi:hypothetical protein E3T26_12135 [Cryobacterium sp. TMT1-21]|uniref:hypothetical protein n=1 Tax=unclassified Cryobacterium TaxID=2649013 RepID=UPI0010694F40|nr:MULTISPECIES: hypothetical protein [unclassified Cryobacterium]TFC86895.1 hypothetical protein E3T24_05795 [Cryobacterium sp. TmT2-59]TFD12024.1 hypothetical protein E3T26_12135 [Cryobacterium sp. TMT1-21]TFD18536.1 hypothetical protein E3T32_11985 [Cryobacterium sp. TMT2-23]